MDGNSSALLEVGGRGLRISAQRGEVKLQAMLELGEGGKEGRLAK